ncbi:MAG: hypothetical protein K8U03_19005 [Planctomycetia bacterium]|nr:hypothetical protein [Planctomycetia bacterium]
MNASLAKQLSIARRRLFLERVVALFPWIATLAFGIAASVIVVDKYFPLGISWPIVLGIAAIIALLATLIAGRATSHDELAAAVELDRRCRLDERVSTALALRSIAGSDVAADGAARRAVEADAERAIANLDVRASFPLVSSRRLAWPLVPLATAVVVALSLSPAVPPVAPAAAAAKQVQAQMKETAATLEKKLEDKKLEAEKLKLVEAQKLLEKLQDEARKIKGAAEVDQKESLVKLNDLAKQIQERREQVSGAEELKKQLSRLRSKNPGASEKLTNAIQEGNFRGAAEQVEQLRKELESGKLDPAQKQQMAEQLDRLQKQMEQLAQAQEERRKEAEQQLAAKQKQAESSSEGKNGAGQKKDGKGSEPSASAGSQPGALDASALAEKLSQMAAQQQSLAGLQEALEQASQGMQSGKGNEASQALNDLQKQLDQLAKQASESQLLDRGLQDLAECKSGMSQGQEPGAGEGKKPGGAPGQNGGNQAQPGQGQPGQGQPGQGMAGQGQGQKGPGAGNQGGNQPGQGVGNGLDGEAPGQTAAFDSRVKQQIGTGAFRIIGPTDGPNAKGKALEAIRNQEQAVSAGREAQTLESQALDRSRREQKKQYFNALRKAD